MMILYLNSILSNNHDPTTEAMTWISHPSRLNQYWRPYLLRYR